MKKELAISLLLVALVGVGAIANHRFLSAFNIGNNLTYLGLFGIFGIGMGIVIITAGIDLSVGSVFALQGVLLAVAGNDWHWPWPLAVLLSVLVVVLIGVFHGAVITLIKLQPFIVTLCGLLFYRGIARYIAHDQSMGLDGSNFERIRNVSNFTIRVGDGGISMAFMLLVVIAVIMWVVLHRSVYGRYLFAVGRNEEAARYSGINTRLVVGSAYALGMLLSSISGLLIIFDAKSVAPSGFAESYELYGIAAAVLGGCSLRGGEGSILGIVLGTALIVVLRNLVPLLGIDSSLEFAVMGRCYLYRCDRGPVARKPKTENQACRRSANRRSAAQVGGERSGALTTGPVRCVQFFPRISSSFSLNPSTSSALRIVTPVSTVLSLGSSCGVAFDGQLLQPLGGKIAELEWPLQTGEFKVAVLHALKRCGFFVERHAHDFALFAGIFDGFNDGRPFIAPKAHEHVHIGVIFQDIIHV